ncbi:FtsX-like permease family protein, partial [Streptomyces sp. HSW2009]|uniref:FtsX-like permease family protein n=1 Tax=Streptomyces sp. HSW2009 TaxID=3142890 RepID=UPI0032EAE8DB
MVAVVGHRAGAPAVTAPRYADPRRPGEIAPPTPVADFTGRAATWGTGGLYTALAKVATVLVLVPLLVLGASSARLTLARRDARLAALRLVGATPARIAGLTAAEAALTGSAGALLGALGYAALLPLAARAPAAGGHWYPADLWLGAPVVLGVLAGVVAMVVGSALAGLRQVVIGPLGVARRARAPRLRAVRAVFFGGALVGYWQLTKDAGTSIDSIVYLVAVVFLALSVIGPWAVSFTHLPAPPTASERGVPGGGGKKKGGGG